MIAFAEGLPGNSRKALSVVTLCHSTDCRRPGLTTLPDRAAARRERRSQGDDEADARAAEGARFIADCWGGVLVLVDGGASEQSFFADNRANRIRRGMPAMEKTPAELPRSYGATARLGIQECQAISCAPRSGHSGTSATTTTNSSRPRNSRASATEVDNDPERKSFCLPSQLEREHASGRRCRERCTSELAPVLR